MKLIMHGAEAKIYRDKNKIIKIRAEKKYRCRELDESLRKHRTRKEVKILEKIAKLKLAPKCISYNDVDTVEMEFVEGKKLSEHLERLKYKQVCFILGQKIRQLHDLEIIHGDLTTSNLIYDDQEHKLYCIDFGLSYTSTKDEDKAVDLHVLHEALVSKHYSIADRAFKEVLQGYDSKKVEKKLVLVELRGRNKQKS
ncbi:Kae1-associated serine/threonine protein kinase [Candidatus Woesearchaeota archaeon]|nr:Kae1-associated serine/threonine protein kinase [Candidatus Woesearchaeota archaeon]